MAFQTFYEESSLTGRWVLDDLKSKYVSSRKSQFQLWF